MGTGCRDGIYEYSTLFFSHAGKKYSGFFLLSAVRGTLFLHSPLQSKQKPVRQFSHSLYKEGERKSLRERGDRGTVSGRCVHS